MVVRLANHGLEVVVQFRIELQHQGRRRPVGNLLDVLGVLAGLGGHPQHLVVHEFDRAGVEVQRVGDRGHRLHEVVVGVEDERRLLGNRHERHGGLDDDAEGSLRADEQFGEVDDRLAVVGFGDGLVEVVARHRPLEARVLPLDFLLVVLDEAENGPVEVGLAVVLADDAVPLVAPDDHVAGVDDRPVREDDPQLLGVSVSDAVADRVRARGVVADAAAHGRSVRGGGVRRELQAVVREAVVEVVLHHAGLDPRPPRVGVHADDFVHVLRAVDDDTAGADGLSRQRRPRPAREHGHVVFGRRPHRGAHVVFVAGDDHARRARPVNRAVGRVQHLRVLVESHLAGDDVPEVGGEVGVFGHVRHVVVARLLKSLEVPPSLTVRLRRDSCRP